MQVYAGLNVSEFLHKTLLKIVFQAPINLFYDVTPLGQILNRFSKDLAVLDEMIYFNFGGFLVCLWQSIAPLVISSTAAPQIIPIILLAFSAAAYLFVYSVKAYKDCYRIEAVVMSPILSFFTESFSGSSVIRAFAKEPEFNEQNFFVVNRVTSAN